MKNTSEKSPKTSKVKEFKEIKSGDVILNPSVLIMCPESFRKAGRMWVYSKENRIFHGLFPKASGASSEGWNFDIDSYNVVKNDIEWADDMKIDIEPIKEQLLELPVIDRILPKNERINEKVFNCVEDGEMPSEEEMRILLLRYHKALLAAEKNIELYDSIIFGEQEEKVEEPEPDLPYGWSLSRGNIKSPYLNKYFTADEYMTASPTLKFHSGMTTGTIGLTSDDDVDPFMPSDYDLEEE